MEKPDHIVPRWTFWLFLFVLAPCSAQQPAVDFLRAHVLIEPDPLEESVAGQVTYQIRVSKPADSIVLDAHNMVFHSVAFDGNPVAFRVLPGKIAIAGTDIPGPHVLQLEYTANPVQSVYFIGWKDDVAGNEQIWTQGQGKDTSHWVPVVDAFSEKVEFDLSLRFDCHYTAIAGGRLAAKTTMGETCRWDYDGLAPMSSYLLAFAIGRFDYLEQQSASGVPLLLYYPDGETRRAEYTYRYSAELFDFLEREIGYPFPWGAYRQVPVRDFLYAGMENVGATFFSDRYLVDSLGYNDENYINVNAHELAHQWFGNLVTETDASAHWLHEGFATFYAYLAEGHVLGADPVFWKLYDTALALEEMDASGKGESLLDPGAGSLTFYEKGAWALFILRETVGEGVFQKAVLNFLNAKAYRTATADDFLGEVEAIRGQSLASFRETWLESADFPVEAAMGFLEEKSPCVARLRALGNHPGEALVTSAWEACDFPGFRARVVRQYPEALSRVQMAGILEEGSPEEQKALLEVLPVLENWMLPQVAALLDAPSYSLRESALFRLWVGDPQGRSGYLEHIAANGSLAEIRVRQFWWLLALLTEGFATAEARSEYLNRLRETTSPAFAWETRQNAFGILYEAGAWDAESLRNLMQATEHHTWQLKKTARRLVETLLEDEPPIRDQMKRLAPGFAREEYPYLYHKLNNL